VTITDARPVPFPRIAADRPEVALAGTPATTWELVRATRAGDQEAFGQIYGRYHQMVFQYVMFRVRDRDLAEDLTADAFLRALRNIASVSYQGRDIGAWLVTIARNLIHDDRKSSRYRRDQSVAEFAERHHPRLDDQEERVLDSLTHEALWRCVAQLSTDQRQVIILRFLHGLSYAETARVMGRNIGAAKELRCRAVRRLAELMPAALR
jgi:RNA polymerase sigma-70 factor, ECF subfamily